MYNNDYGCDNMDLIEVKKVFDDIVTDGLLNGFTLKHYVALK